MDSVSKIERVKRAARLSEFWRTKGHDGEVVAVVRAPAQNVKSEPDQYRITFIATTEAVDVDDEVVIASGVKRNSYFFTNKACFIDHQYDLGSFIGNAARIIPRPGPNSPKAWEVQMRLHKDHQYTPMILSLASDGMIGSSIGFARIAGGRPTPDEVKQYTKGGREPQMITRQWEWIEQSITAMPANVEARSTGFEAAKSAMLDELVTKGTIDRCLAVALGMPESPRRKLYPVADEPRRRVIRVVDMGNIAR